MRTLRHAYEDTGCQWDGRLDCNFDVLRDVFACGEILRRAHGGGVGEQLGVAPFLGGDLAKCVRIFNAADFLDYPPLIEAASDIIFALAAQYTAGELRDIMEGRVRLSGVTPPEIARAFSQCAGQRYGEFASGPFLESSSEAGFTMPFRHIGLLRLLEVTRVHARHFLRRRKTTSTEKLTASERKESDFSYFDEIEERLCYLAVARCPWMLNMAASGELRQLEVLARAGHYHARSSLAYAKEIMAGFQVGDPRPTPGSRRAKSGGRKGDAAGSAKRGAAMRAAQFWRAFESGNEVLFSRLSRGLGPKREEVVSNIAGADLLRKQKSDACVAALVGRYHLTLDEILPGADPEALSEREVEVVAAAGWVGESSAFVGRPKSEQYDLQCEAYVDEIMSRCKDCW